MKENPRIQAKWDGGSLRGSLTSSKLAALRKEEQDGNVDLRARDHMESSIQRGTYI